TPTAATQQVGAAAAAHTTVAQGNAVPDAMKNAQGRKLRMVSFSHLNPKKEEEVVTQKTTTTLVTPLIPEEVYKAWYELSNSLLHEERDVAQRMRDVQPQVREGHVLELEVANPLVEQAFRTHDERLLGELRERLQNCRITFLFTQKKIEEMRMFSAADHYRNLLQTHAPLQLLVEKFQLELV
ncbi:MAG: hypothetical protein HUK03_06615, partial [Bacteroidaceae bacterium]|nr:hypothetical protein [Bacteroidaceae bacterium]